MNEVEHILAIRNKLGEGPLWHAEEGLLYWVDIDGHCFYRMDPASSDPPQRFNVGLPLGALAFRASGGLVLATKDGFAFWDEVGLELDFIVDPEADKPSSRFNDGAVDRHGRFWAGTLGDGTNNALYRLDPDGSLQTMETNIGVSNGIGWSPDNQTMYYADSPRQTIYAYDYDAATGAISRRRDFIHDPDEPGFPDGLTVDSNGFIWSARWGGWSLLRYDPQGRLERKIPMPVEYPTSCIFGGADLDELYITSAWTALGETRKDEQPLAGDLFRLKTTVSGLPEPKFAA
jgi:sugar lactone lactonase YvrE